MKVFIQKAAQYGAKVVSDKGKHLKFRDGLGHQISAPKTTSDFRAIRNFESELKGRGFVRQETQRKVKDALVKGSKETVLKPTVKQPANAGTVNRQTTFKDFTRKFQPNVQGPKRSELQVQADHILKTERKRRKMITKSQLDAMSISQKERDELIRKGLVNMSEQHVKEQMVAPKKPGKRDLLDLTPTEKKLDAIIRLSNRSGVRRALMTGKAVYPFSEDNKHRDAKLNYQYKEVTNPKRPEDPIKKIKKGLV